MNIFKNIAIKTLPFNSRSNSDGKGYKMKKIVGFCKELKFASSLLFRANGFLFIPYIFIRLIMSTLPILKLYVFNLLITSLVTETNEKKVFSYIVGFVICMILTPIVENIFNILYRDMNEKMLNTYEISVNEKLAKMPMAFLDSGTGRNVIDDVVDAKNTVCTFLFKVEHVINQLYVFIVSVVVLMKYNMLITLLFLVFTIPGAIFRNYSDVLIYSWNVKSAPDVRKFSYYRWMLTDPWPSKDVRMYNLTDHIKERYRQEKGEYLYKKRKLSKKGLNLGYISTVIEQLGIILYTLFIMVDAYQGNIKVGEIGLYSGLAITTLSAFGEIISMMINFFSLSLKRFESCFSFFAEKNEDDYFATNISNMEINFEELEFRNVYFKYPFADDYILKDVSFKLCKGDRLSIVGVNGSGKTTIIKLILGLYLPDKGQILLNGKNITEYNLNDIRNLFSVIFQAYVSYPLTLRENVALSDLKNINNEELIKEALLKSEFIEKYNEFSKGIETYLTRQFDDAGEELSRGQWQKIALARTYFKNASIVIFDEPSAALDAEAENKVFEDYRNLSVEKTSIMISHRMSGVTISNKILVIDDGTVVEKGKHKELMNQNGVYAKLYNMQKEKYIREGEV